MDQYILTVFLQVATVSFDDCEGQLGSSWRADQRDQESECQLTEVESADEESDGEVGDGPKRKG